ncbi:transmembrane protein 160 [Spinachia spinachia]
MAFLSLFLRRQLPPAVSRFARTLRPVRPAAAPLRRLHGSAGLRVGETDPWGRVRGPEQHQLSDLDKADALMLRKSHETGFLSWFRNGLLATGIGVIAFVQSEVGREAGYAFFILGGVCVVFGGASYIGSLFAFRRMMLLSVPALLLQSAVVGSVALFWLCAVSLYIGRLEVEIIHEEEEDEEDGRDDRRREDEGECRECRERREHRGYRGSHGGGHHGREDNDGKGPKK